MSSIGLSLCLALLGTGTPANADVRPIAPPALARTTPASSQFTANAPAPSGIGGFANYGGWVTAGSANAGHTRVCASSTNGRSITMQVLYTDVNGNQRIDASGGLSSSVDYTFRAQRGCQISVRFRVGTLDNDGRS